MQSVHESFTNTDLTNWLVQTGFYEHESHELACCAGKNHGDRFLDLWGQVVFQKQPVPRDPKTCPRDSSVPVILKIIS